MQIQTSSDWARAEQAMLEKASLLPHASQDLQKICKNIQILVSALSREEIVCRRLQRQTLKHTELVADINKQIEFFDKLVTFAALIQNN